MKEELFDKLTEKNSSWAYWPNDNWEKIDKVFFISNLNILKTNVIFLGLNQSKQVETPLINFHTPNHKGDKTLSSIVLKYKNLTGGFMTDICSVIEPDSNKVQINTNETDQFISKLTHFEEKKISIICFGDKVYNSLKEFLDVEKEIHYLKLKLLHFPKEITNNIVLDVYRVWHYSNYGKFQEKISELDKQLEFIDNKINQEKI